MVLPVEVPAEDLPDQASTQSEPQSGQPVPQEDLPQSPQVGAQTQTESALFGPMGQSFGLGAAEKVAEGALPFGKTVVAGAEKALTSAGVPGLTPEDQAAREEVLKQSGTYVPQALEAAGLAGSFFTGLGEARVLGKTAEGALTLAKLANIDGKLASGAIRAGSELAAMQTDNEVAKAINGQSKGVGDAITNIGLSAALGGLTGGTLTAAGMLGGKILDIKGVQIFKDKLASLMSGLDPKDVAESEFNKVINQYHAMGSDLWGSEGIKAQALKYVLPEQVTPEISGQIQNISDNAQGAIKKMVDQGVPDNYIKKYINNVNTLQETLTNPSASTYDIYDALNTFKKDTAAFSKGNYGPWSVPSYHEAYDFLNITKGVGHDVRVALEDPDVWGKAGDLQKTINQSFQKSNNAVKVAQSTFMKDLGNGELEPSSDKFRTYFNQTGKATDTIDKQKIMKNFVDSMDNHYDAVNSAFKSAGVENPYPPLSMPTLSESTNKVPWQAQLATKVYNYLAPSAIGNLAGTGVGSFIGNKIVPGYGFIAGSVAGQKILGPTFGALAQSIMKSSGSLTGLDAAFGLANDVGAGTRLLKDASKAMFESYKRVIPEHMIPDKKKIEKLDAVVQEKMNNGQKPQQLLKSKKTNKKQTQNFAQGGIVENNTIDDKDPEQYQSMMNVTGNLDHYLPDSAQMLARTAMNAVNYLHSQRPSSMKTAPLDNDLPPSKHAQKDYERKLQIAEQPLMAFHKMKEGTLLPDDVQTLKTLYPEHYDKMSASLMNAMTDHIHKGGSIPYRLKQSMSLFMGMPMDSTLKPQNIVAAQGVFAQQAAQRAAQPQQGNLKKGTKPLSKVSENFATADQAAAKRQTEIRG